VAADAHGLVGVPDVEALRVGLAVDATEPTPSSRQARITRIAISPRLAMRILLNTALLASF